MSAPANINAVRSFAVRDLAVTPEGSFEMAVLVLPGFSHFALHAYVEPFRFAN